MTHGLLQLGNRRRRWLAAAAICSGAVALSPLGAAGASSPASHEARPSAAGMRPASHGLAYYNLHPCDLITRGEVEAVYDAPMGPGDASPNAYGGSCNYNTTSDLSKDDTKSLVYSFDPGTAASAAEYLKGPKLREPSVGHNAYCVGSSSHNVALEADVGNANGSPYHLNMASDSCADAVRLAKVAFSHLG